VRRSLVQNEACLYDKLSSPPRKRGKETGCSILSRTNRRPSCAGLTRVSTRLPVPPADVHCARGWPDQVRPWLPQIL